MSLGHRGHAGLGRATVGATWGSDGQEWPFFMRPPQHLPPKPLLPAAQSFEHSSRPLSGSAGQRRYVMRSQPPKALPPACGQRMRGAAFPRVELLGSGPHLPQEQEVEQKELVRVLSAARNRRLKGKGLEQGRRCVSCTNKPRGTTAQGQSAQCCSDSHRGPVSSAFHAALSGPAPLSGQSPS